MSEIEKSVVQIFSDHLQYSYIYPWSSGYKYHSSGTGFCLSSCEAKKYILTNAHCVDNSTYVTATKRNNPQRHRMKIALLIYECDLAILTTDDKEFWADLQPLVLGNIPAKLDKVYVYGYPLGGYNISVTKGIVNRIQIIPYFSMVNGIAIQIDASINFGNSGGPVVDQKGEVVGVAFAGEDRRISQNMGYIIPTTFIKFIVSIWDTGRRFRGLCTLGINTQTLNNPGIREYYKTKSGILVTKVSRLGSSYGLLKPGDVILSIDNLEVRSDGTVPLEKIIKYNITDEIVPYTNITSLKKPGDVIPLTILRGGKTMDVKIKLQPEHFLIPILEYQLNPSYLIVAGLIFIPLSYMFLEEKRQEDEPIGNMIGLLQREAQEENEQIIILSQIIRSSLTEDYRANNDVLVSLNEHKVTNLTQLYSQVNKEMKKSEYLIFGFEQKEIIFKVSDVKKYHKEILEINFGNIPDYLPTVQDW